MARELELTFTCPANEVAGRADFDDVFLSGEALLKSMAPFLVARGVLVGDIAPEDHHGWVVRVRIHGRKFDLHITRDEDCIVIIHQVGILDFLRSKRAMGECFDELSEAIVQWVASECRGEVLRREDGWVPPF
jgi:hypothetical protein